MRDELAKLDEDWRINNESAHLAEYCLYVDDVSAASADEALTRTPEQQ